MEMLSILFKVVLGLISVSGFDLRQERGRLWLTKAGLAGLPSTISREWLSQDKVNVFCAQ